MRILFTTLLSLALPAAGAAQSANAAFDREEARPQAPSAFAPASSPTPGITRALTMVGGAAIGAWVGYMASQVAVGDWEDETAIDRGTWAVSGAALGLTLGLSVRGGRTPPTRPGNITVTDPKEGRNFLTTKQIRRAQSGSMYDVIRSLRPEWLRTRGTGSMRETATGSADGTDWDVEVRPGIPTIRIYLDDSLVGDTDALRTIDAGMVGEARFLSPAEATHRWGAGHIHGAIHVLTASVR